MRLAALLALLLAAPLALAQKEKVNPLDKIDGYKRQTVEGFTLLVSDDVAKADTAEFDRKPAEVLELELKMIVKLMTTKQVDLLRKLPVWVEWDAQEKLPNGRPGNALAMYYGGHQANLLQEGKQPLKAKTVTILRMKSLTAEHQPKTDSGRCVLLHEFAHAVHDQILGRDHEGIKAAYTQALERKLYDKEQYVSTNEAEFFAELTCAYFDQLQYFPKTRDELKKHDPVSHKLLESIWGKEKKGEPAAEAKGRGALSDTGADKFDLAVKLDDLKYGDPLLGPAFKPDDLKGKVAVVAFFGPEDYPVLGKLADLHRELSPYGVAVVGGPGQVIAADKLKKDLADRDLPFPTTAALMLRDKDDRDRFTGRKPSHTLVFDADGTCVFRGSGHDAAPHARAAVARTLVAKAVTGDTPKSLKPITDALLAGQPLLDGLPKLYQLALSNDEATAKPSKELLAALTAPGIQLLDDAKKLTKSDPLAAFLMLEGQPGKYKGTALAEKMTSTLDGLKTTTTVAAEIKARSALEPIKKLDAAILAQAGGFDPTDPKFQQKNAGAISDLKAAVEQMKKKHPGAKATEQAETIAKKYGK